MKFLAILLIFCAANCCFAIKRTTVCPTKEVVSDFDFENYMGEWFELKKYAFQSEKTYKCVTTNYTLKDLTSFYFKHEYLDENNEHKGAGGNPSIGYLTFPDEKPLKGKISLIYRPKGGPNEVPKPNYFILDTDYTNYSIVWGCRNLPSSTTEFKSDELAWVLSRTANPNEEVQKLIDDSVEKYLEISSLKKTDQNAGLCGYD